VADSDIGPLLGIGTVSNEEAYQFIEAMLDTKIDRAPVATTDEFRIRAVRKKEVRELKYNRALSSSGYFVFMYQIVKKSVAPRLSVIWVCTSLQ